MVAFGNPNCGVFKTLKASARKYKLKRSERRNARDKPTSKFVKLGPRRKFRPESPKLNCAGATNADVSNQRVIDRCSDGRLPSPIRLGRAVAWVFDGSKLKIGVNGSPDCHVVIPLICHLPAKAVAQACPGRIFL
jgi:hypothetical protein